jgi:hypothetical protein
MIKQLLKTLKKLANKETFTFKGVYTFTLENVITGEKRVIVNENLVVLTGKSYIMTRLMADQVTPGIKITHTALGTGTNAPASGDTQLQTEIYRKNVASATNASNIGYVSAYYTAVEVTGTFREVGLFINATGVANSGTLFSRVATNITKSSVETLTVDYQLTLN